MIPILDLTRQYETLQQQVDEAVLNVMRSGVFILGPNVKAFEQEVAQYLGAGHALGVASGTDALYLGLKALEIGPGDEVITTAFSYIATSEAIVRTGATPVFVELDPDTFNMDLNQIEAKITPRTRALLPVHLYGQPLDMDVLIGIAKKHNLAVVEDCAQSMGSEWKGKKVGTFGDVGCFSFFPTKNLGCYGDGGLVCTNNPEVHDKMRKLRAHGSETRYYHDLPGGINSRLDEMQAAVLRIKLPKLDEWNRKRLEVANRYSDALRQIDGIRVPEVIADGKHVFHQYTVRIEKPEGRRDDIQKALQERGVQSMIYYPLPLHMQGTHKTLGYKQGDLPITERVAAQVLSLPIFPELTDAEINQVVNGLREAVAAMAQPV